MGFSPEIKEKVLVASIRRCCLCKEYKGRNIEIHHIIPESENGESTFDNAIPLCFDCHANVGHYNPKHPRGTKFSRDEIKKQRDYWYKLVEKGVFNVNNINVSQQFFLTNSFDIVTEIINGDFTNFPFNEVKLLENNLFHYLKSIENFLNNSPQNNVSSEKNYNSLEDYLVKHPESKKIESNWGTIHYERIPTVDELHEQFYNKDFVVNYMLRNNADPIEISRASFHEVGCCNWNFEIFKNREFKVVFLSLFNSSNETLFINSISEFFESDGGFSHINKIETNLQEINLKSLSFESGKCLLIPYCVVLMPFENEYEVKEQLLKGQIGTGQSQDVREIELNQINNYLTIGPRERIQTIVFSTNTHNESMDIKELNLKNLLLISRFWECGSCPHLFAKKYNSSEWEYVGELFSHLPYKNQEIVFNTNNLPLNYYEFIKIVEIENEITTIDKITIDNEIIETNIILIKGEEYILKLIIGSVIKICGKYSLIKNVKYVEDSNMKQQKIYFKLSEMNRN